MRILWINEELVPPDKDYTQIFGFEDFKTDIDYNGLPDEIWFCAKTGYECAEYLVKYCSENNYATPRYHLEQMKLEDARKIIYLIEDYNLNYIREHGISEENLLKHFIEIIGNTNIEKIGSITYAINKHEKELEALLPLEDNLRGELASLIGSDNEKIANEVCEQLIKYDTTIKEYIKASKFAKESKIPTKLSQLENDAGYLKEQQDISGLATKSDIPTKTSQLENDSGFLTEHQNISKLATKEEVNNQLFLKANKTELSKKANIADIPTKLSQLTNDMGFASGLEIPSGISAFENDIGYITSADIKDKANTSFVVQLIVDYAKLSYVNNNFATKAEVAELSKKIDELMERLDG